MNAAYHHFGMISPFKVARDLVRNSSNGSKKFFDEFMTWRELSYAFCFQRWPDLESMQVSLQCPTSFLASNALIRSDSAYFSTHGTHVLTSVRSIAQSLRCSACSHLELAFLGSRHTTVCIVP